eukprot:TRINITY_DN48916_c0_g1_i1.p1 TRINITY_DN48916_c0_g1~~TRINITY_DN48916_c0_g1_i1.p1  ORF type:complete len:224 (-),score=33.43 TRINITY_DN48916_c0_g1_i1:175-807(-)
MSQIILCIRNVPCRVLETQFLATMQELGLDTSRYEIFFPKRPRRQRRRYNNFGYGFVECSGQEDAEAFARAMHVYRFEHIDSHKQLLVELGNWNPASASSQSEAPGALHAAVEASADSGWTYTSAFAVGQSLSVPLSSSESMSFATREATYPVGDIALQKCSTILAPKQPNAHEVPPTRLAIDESSVAHFAAHSRDEFWNGSSQHCFRLQ